MSYKPGSIIYLGRTIYSCDLMVEVEADNGNKIDFFVINGHWSGTFWRSYNKILINETQAQCSYHIVWDIQPAPGGGYNASMNKIQDMLDARRVSPVKFGFSMIGARIAGHWAELKYRLRRPWPRLKISFERPKVIPPRPDKDDELDF